jgi:cell wall-associated NlpC family hydrolase
MRPLRKLVTAGFLLRIGKSFGLVTVAVIIGSCALSKPYQDSGPPSRDAAALLQTARSQLGTPYVAGAVAPGKGFDCSGFTQWVFRQHGVALPRQSYDQYQIGEQVKSGNWQAGDLVFFDVEKKGASHVGIYVSRGWFVHCSSTGGRVREDFLGEKYWQKHYLGARRILP